MKQTKRVHAARYSILLPCAAVIVTCLLSGFGFSPNSRTVQELLKQRSDIIQLVWYSQLTPKEGEAMLRTIETHPLLAQDVAWLRAAEEGMDFAYVLDMELLELTKTSRSVSGICYQADIRWEIAERGGRVTEYQNYSIRLKQQAGKLLLAEFQLSDPSQAHAQNPLEF